MKRCLKCYIECYISIPVRYINQDKKHPMEGALRCDELKIYLDKIGAPPVVWLSEDGSGIIQRAVYDVNSNKLVGINLPLNELTGMPITSSYFARTLSDIKKHMKNQLSSLVYLVMAQPAKSNCPPFVLMLFGTNNKFTTRNVLDRMKTTIHELKKWVQIFQNCCSVISIILT